MPLKCKSGTTPSCRFKKTKKSKLRLCGCMRKGRFVKIKEVKKFK